MGMSKHFWTGWVSGALLLLSAGAHADWGYDASAAVGHDDNLSNGFQSEDRKGDNYAELSLSGGWHEQLSDSTGLSLSLLADSNTYFRYSGLTNLGIGGRAQLRTKFGLGAEAPWLAFFAQALHYDYHYDYRDGWHYEAGATAGKQLDERWTVRGTARYDASVSDHVQAPVVPGIPANAYDVFGWTLGVQAAFQATEDDTLSVGYSHRTGPVVAVTRRDYEIFEYSDRIARDTVFSETMTLVAYRIQAKTDTASVSWSHALGQHAAISLSYAYRRSRAASDLGDYYANLISLSLSYSH